MSLLRGGLSIGMGGADIARLHDLLEQTKTKPSPAEVKRQEFGVSTKNSLKAFQKEAGLDQSGILDDRTLSALRAATAIAEWAIYGTVRYANGLPAEDLIVQAYDRDFRALQPLGEGITDAEGRYSIRYDATAFARAEKAGPDISLEVRWKGADEPVYADDASTTHYNASREARIDIDLGAVTVADANEFDRLTAMLAQLVEKTSIEDIAANGRLEDVIFLSRETGIDQPLVEHVVVAHRLGAYVGLPAAVFYALLRTDVLVGIGPDRANPVYAPIGVSTPIELVYFDAVRLDSDTFFKAVQRAVAAAWISRQVLDLAKKAFSRLSEDRAKADEFVRTEGPRRLNEAIAPFLTQGNADLTEEILASALEGDTETLMKQLGMMGQRRPKGSRAAGTRIELTRILGFDTDILERASAAVGKRKGGASQLARVGRDVIREMLASAGEAAKSTGRTSKRASQAEEPPSEDDHLERDVATVEALASKRFPSAAMALRLERDPAVIDKADDVRDFFDAHPEFDLAKHNLGKFISSSRAKALRSVPESTFRQIEAVQRTYRLVEDPEKATALLRSGIRSSADIVMRGRTSFIKEAETSGLSVAEAEAVYARSEGVHLATTLLATDLRAYDNGVEGMELARMETRAKLIPIIGEHPTLKSLFATQDICACEECRSIYGPAAYIADVLRWLSKRLVIDQTNPGSASTRTAKDILFARRPDIGDIDLNCENAETPIPHIDLVCELLEEEIAQTPTVAFNGAIVEGAAPSALISSIRAASFEIGDKAIIYGPHLPDEFVARDEIGVYALSGPGPNWTIRRLRQTHGTAAERAAAPEYVNAAAYAALKAGKAAFTLPFDLFHQETRAFLAGAGLDRAELMRAVQQGGIPAAGDIEGETLGLSNAEQALVFAAAVADQPEIWGVQAATAAPTMERMDVFLDKTGLTYAEAEAMIALPYVAGGANLFIHFDDSSCDLAMRQIRNLTDAILDRIHRVLRLSKRVGVAVADLDRLALATRLGNGNLGAAARAGLVGLMRLAPRLGTDLPSLITWLDVIPSNGLGSLHAMLFQNVASTGPLDPILLPAGIKLNEQNETAVPGSGRKLASVEADLARAFATTESAIASIRARIVEIGTFGPQPPLSFLSLAAVYGRVELARVLGLAAEKLIRLERLLNVNPLSSVAQLDAFVTAAKLLEKTGVDVEDLDYRLRRQAADLAVRDPPQAALVATLTDLRSALVEAAAQTRSAFDASQTVEEGLAGFRTALEREAALDPAARAVFEQLMRDAPLAAPVVVAAKAVVDGALADKVDGAVVKAAIDLVAAAANAGPIVPATLETVRLGLMQALMDGLAASALATRAKEAAIAAVMTQTGLDLASATLFVDGLRIPIGVGRQPIGTPLTTGPITDPTVPLTDAAAPHPFRALRAAVLATGLLAPFAPSTELLQFLIEDAPALGVLDLGLLPFEAGIPPLAYPIWRDWADIIALAVAYPPRVRIGGGQVGALDIFRASGAGVAAATLLADLALVTGWPADLVTALHTHFGATVPDYGSPSHWRRMERAAGLIAPLSVDLPQAVALASAAPGAAESTAARAMLRRRYRESDWLMVLKGIMDPLRELKRDALVAHLLATNPALTSTLDLYDHFLIDTLWSAKMPGSRIVTAHGTLQHYIRRCLSGDEPTATADVEGDSGWSWWDWQSQFRPWQVARQVWTEPQYYLRPEWRDDKTEAFAALNDSLMQDEINAETTEAAVEGYLDYLDQIAFLDVLATCYDFDREQMHIFARTKGGEPEVYYHRIFERERTFTPWAKIDLDIAGDHLIAFFRNKRLYLAWPLIQERGNDQQDVSVPNSAPNTPIDKSERRIEIKLAISEYTGKRWLPRRTSKDAVVTPWSIHPVSIENIVFTVSPAARFTIDVFYFVDGYYAGLGRFLLNGCKGYPEVDPTPPGWANILPAFEDTRLNRQRFLENVANPGDDLVISTIGTGGDQQLFGRTPGRFRVTYPFQASEFDRLISSMIAAVLSGNFKRDREILIYGTLMPWFFEDNQRGYVLVPGLERREEGKDEAAFRTFTNLRRFLMDVIALVQKYIQLVMAATSQAEVDDIIGKIPSDLEFIRLRDEFQQIISSRFGYKVRNFYHPFACKIRETFYTGGIKALMRRDLQLTTSNFDFGSTTTGYAPTSAILDPYPIEQFEFGREDAYGVYNMELFFHIPHLIGAKLIEDERFDDAETWLRYIFDPLGSQGGPAPQKYWITKPFFEHSASDYAAQRITDLVNKLAHDPNGTTELELIDRIEEWRNAPYKPYLVARGRPVAFQQAIVDLTARLYMGRSDSFFGQDTLEGLVQAELGYSRVERLIGKRPRIVPSAVPTPPSTFNQLEPKLDAFGNALMSLENLVPDLSVLPQGGAELPTPPISLESLYFCIPPSPKLYELWDMLELRQFSLRNSQTIDGVERSLSLFAPPLSVEALIAASASGLSISAILAAIGAPRPPYKFTPTLHRALEVATVAQAFGEKLLQALKDRNGEALLRLSAEQLAKLRKEQKVLYAQERLAAAKQREGAEAAKAVFVDQANWARSRPYMNVWETLGVAANGAALLVQTAVAVGYIASGGLKLLPKFMIGAAGFGGSPTANAQTGGDHFGNAAEDLVKTLESLVSVLSMGGSMLETQGVYNQRADQHAQDAVQSDLQATRAEREIELQKIREVIALESERVQNIEIEQADAQLDFLSTKFTRTELFDWLAQRLRTAYRQVYDLALAAARQAERCMNFELGTEVSMIRGDQWDSSRRGLLAAESLTVDLRRLEAYYFENNVREREITRRISLARLDPVALLGLRTNGRCRIELPEQLFDLDHPGHYCRRIRHVSLSIPSVAGPYTAVPVKLTLIDNRVRVSTARKPGGGLTDAQAYAEDQDDPRFVYHVGAIEAIDTSRGDEDSGLFAPSLDDQRYLPFEGAGAISSWTLELPQALRPFDYNTITDAILTIRYTARDGGSSLRNMVANGIRTRLDAMALATSRTGLFHSIDIKRDRPDLWHLFSTTNAATIPLSQEDLPYFARGHTPTSLSIVVLARTSGAPPASLDIGGAPTPVGAAPGPELAGLLMASPAVVPFNSSLAIAKPALAKFTELVVVINYRLAT